MPFKYSRVVRFQDTDSAGVVYFANVLAMCHEAYEASLAASGLNLHTFFCYPKIAIPITHANVDFFRPMFCGDRQVIQLNPRQLGNSSFEINYEIFIEGDRDPEMPDAPSPCVARANTQHVCINSAVRAKTTLPPDVMRWLEHWGETIEIL